MRNLFLLLLFIAGFWACQPEEACISAATNRLVLDFYVPTDSVPVRDTIFLFQVRSTASDTLFWNSSASATDSDSTARLFLRLNPNKDTTTFIFNGNGRTDELVLSYKRRYRLISPDCPLEVRFEQLQVVGRSTFDSVRVVNQELIEPSNDTDIQVFY